jgi:hypothetical protein
MKDTYEQDLVSVGLQHEEEAWALDLQQDPEAAD